MRSILAVVVSILILTQLAVCGDDAVKKEKNSFLDKYQFFLIKQEKKTLDKIKTSEEFKKFESEFWNKRDPISNTPQNEFKQEVDSRLEDITNNISMDESGLPNTCFGRNGGSNGEMARVYLLYGEPGFKKFLRGRSFVELLLWVYNDEDGYEKYRFLFYRKGNSGYFRLFRDQEFLTKQVVVKELANWENSFIDGRFQADEIVQEIRLQGGEIFIRALLEFSDDSAVKLEEAIESPAPEVIRELYKGETVNSLPEQKPAGETQPSVLKLQPQVELPTQSKTEVAKSKILEGFSKTSIPADLSINGKVMEIIMLASNLDWTIVGENAECVFVFRLVLQSKTTKEVYVFEQEKPVLMPAKDLDDEDERIVSLSLSVEGVDSDLNSGKYSTYIYLKNKATKKYSAWLIN